MIQPSRTRITVTGTLLYLMVGCAVSPQSNQGGATAIRPLPSSEAPTPIVAPPTLLAQPDKQSEKARSASDSEHAKTPKEPVRGPSQEEEAAWRLKYQSATAEQLGLHMRSLLSESTAATHRAGMALYLERPEAARDVPALPGLEPAGEQLYVTRFGPGAGEVLRVYLREDEYGHLYAMRREVEWLKRERIKLVRAKNP